MKRIIFGLMLAMMFCTLVQGANRTVTENDGQGNKKRVIELRDTVINGETVTDTLSVMTYENGAGSSNAPEKWRTHHSSMDWNGFDLGSKTSETVIAVTAIVFVFGLPLLIIFVVFFFRYKNRKAKYRLAEQALGQAGELLRRTGREPTVEEIAAQLDMEAARVRELLQLSQDPISLETPVGEEEDAHLEDFIRDDEAGIPADEAGRQLLRRELMTVLKSLTPPGGAGHRSSLRP